MWGGGVISIAPTFTTHTLRTNAPTRVSQAKIDTLESLTDALRGDLAAAREEAHLAGRKVPARRTTVGGRGERGAQRDS